MQKQAQHFISGISLQQLVNNLVSNSRSIALDNKSKVVNDVGEGLLLSNRQRDVISVMRDLLNTVLINSRNGDIYITADLFKDIVTLQIEERNNFNGYALAHSISTIQPDAAEIGGNIRIDGPRQKVATILFSFPNHVAGSNYSC